MPCTLCRLYVPAPSYQRIEEHKGSAVATHLREQHDLEPDDITQSFRILRKRHLIVLFSKCLFQRPETNANINKQFVYCLVFSLLIFAIIFIAYVTYLTAF